MESRRCIGGSPSSADAVAMLTRRLQRREGNSCTGRNDKSDLRRFRLGQPKPNSASTTPR